MKIFPAGGRKIPALHAPRVLLSAHTFNPRHCVFATNLRLLKYTRDVAREKKFIKPWENVCADYERSIMSIAI